MNLARWTAAALASILLQPNPALAQDPEASARYDIALTDGATPNIVALEIGGGELASPCGGQIASAPDIRLSYTGDDDALVISASPQDATLLVKGEDGSWFCSDAAEEIPTLRFDRAESGAYVVWIGSAGSASASITFASEP